MNKIPGIITSVLVDELFVQVNISYKEFTFSACILNTEYELPFTTIGLPVVMTFKETDTMIILNDESSVSCRNRIPAIITDINSGKVMTRIVSYFNDIPIVSIITTASAGYLNLCNGMTIFSMIKSTSVSLNIPGVGV